MPITVENEVASSVGSQIPAASCDPSDARSAMTPSGASATFDVLMARNSTIAFVAVPLCGFRVSSSCIALMPNGVAAFAKPSMFEAMFMIMALCAG